MDDLAFTTKDLPFKSNQIVCLEHQDTNLYGEVIQLIPHRGLCWFRPICLIVSELDCTKSEQTQAIDLHGVSDLLWPTVLFRLAIDTEIIDHLSQLKNDNQNLMDKKPNKHLNRFVQQVWRANQDKF